MQITLLLEKLDRGDQTAFNALIPLVYEELKKLARAHLRREYGAAPLEPTVLVHEAFLKLAAGKQPSYENRAHFFGIASRVMRQILVDTCRARLAAKRSAAEEVSLAESVEHARSTDRQLLAIEDALRELEHTDPLQARLIEMRFFGGMTAEEASTALSQPVHIIRRELRFAQAWLRRELAGGRPGPPIPAL